MATKPRVPLPYLLLFASLYAVQGVVVAYMFNFNKPYMIAAGVPEGRVAGVETLAMLPFVFKFLAGPLSDRVNLLGWGHRKPYIVLGILVQSFGLAGLTFVDPGRHLDGFGAMALLAVSGLALYDTCCDGMVLDITPPGDRSRVQGVLMTSRFLATTVFTLIFGLILKRTGTGPGHGSGVIWVCAGLGLVPLFLAIPLREPGRAADTEAFQWSALRVLILPRSLVLLAFGAFYALIGLGAEINLSTYYLSQGFDPGDVGVFGSLRYLGRAAGAVALPLVVPWLGRRGMLLVGILGLSGATAAQAWTHGRPWVAGTTGFVFGASNGWNDVVFQVLAMEASDPRLAASTYALFMAVTNLSVIGNWLFARGVLAFQHDYARVYLVAAGLTLLLLPVIPPLRRPASHPGNDEEQP